jgi:hypothetical protein
MLKDRQAFLTILLIELDDLEQDIQMLIKNSEEEHDGHKLTNYVFIQNAALMHEELFGIKSFREEISHIDASEYPSLQDLIDDLNSKIKQRVEKQGIPNSFLLAMNRKIEKVMCYVKQE